MSATENDERLAAIEARLAKIEAAFAAAPREAPASALPPQAAFAHPPQAAARPAQGARRPQPPKAPSNDSSSAANLLGWGGAIALVLAASYLIRLAIDSGWLTPTRQVAFAALFGLLLVAAGFFLRRNYRRYAGLLPAAGIAVLFLAIYGGHLYHHIIGIRAAGGAVIVVCAFSLWLCRAFESDLYALFAVAGSYSAPFLLAGVSGSLTDIAVYYSAWGVVFSVFAVWHGSRLVYLLALYFALIGFDYIAGNHGQGQWRSVLAFQTAQFAIFGAATAVFSVRHAAPLTTQNALAHLPPLLLFYFLQYHLLHKHLPVYAPWIAVASLAAVAALYGIARARLERPLPGGELLLWSYAALVLFHAGFMESVPTEWAPWFALVVLPLGILATLREDGVGARWPVLAAVGIFFVANFLCTIFEVNLEKVPGRQWLPAAYALLLYLGYWLGTQRDTLGRAKLLLLYMGHVSAMAAAVRILSEPIIESAVWGVLAIACLALASRQNDKLLAQSSLAVFGAAAAKVMLFDLAGASPVARIVGLVVLGVTFYAGGLLYQRVAKNAAAAPAPAATQ
jgi:uncharacterized membrane protein